MPNAPNCGNKPCVFYGQREQYNCSAYNKDGVSMRFGCLNYKPKMRGIL